jgi:hypothetical protein
MTNTPETGREKMRELMRLLRRWLGCFLLATPIIFMPISRVMTISHSWYDLGWPFAGFVVGLGKPLVVSPTWLMPLTAIGWILVAFGARRTWDWAVACTRWWGSLAQAVLISAYCVLLFLFGCGLTAFAWEGVCRGMDWEQLERAFRFARLAAPIALSLGAGVILVTIGLNSRRRRMSQRLFHVICIVLVWHWLLGLLPYATVIIGWFDEGIQVAQHEQLKEHNTAR